ncbi:ALA-interacting subunit [Quillaja saponaria]|uniref:ALA-interacting subunit n=1 Tax=Quillaja saponaria TaxID=32244 RepID=A0AAD7LLF6_QUISA|nr:ALA-interacting subunit [Quillaja saponaria]
MSSKSSTSSSGGKDGSSNKNSKKPQYSRFSQQELPAWKPILTPGWVISSFIAVGIIFIPLGLISLSASKRVVEIMDRYDQECVPSTYRDRPLTFIQQNDDNKTCTRMLTVREQMKAPIYVYYELDNFYQNHRRYVKSKNDHQLRSKAGEDQTGDCEPEDKTNDKVIVPCGLIAWSLFNDTYSFSVKNKSIEVSKKNIAWKSDKKHKFGSDCLSKEFSDWKSEQEDLIVWMRTAALPNFRKLYGKIEVDLEANDNVHVEIENNYNTYSFGGKKRLVLSTTTWIGGKNDFLGHAYLAIGGMSLFFAIAFILLYVIKPRPLGDPSYLSWNQASRRH